MAGFRTFYAELACRYSLSCMRCGAGRRHEKRFPLQGRSSLLSFVSLALAVGRARSAIVLYAMPKRGLCVARAGGIVVLYGSDNYYALCRLRLDFSHLFTTLRIGRGRKKTGGMSFGTKDCLSRVFYSMRLSHLPAV